MLEHPLWRDESSESQDRASEALERWVHVGGVCVGVCVCACVWVGVHVCVCVGGFVLVGG